MDNEERIKQLEIQVAALRGIATSQQALLGALLRHFDSNEHTAQFIATAIEGAVTGALLDGTIHDAAIALIEPAALATLPPGLRTAVQSLRGNG